jgi:hypothetical protein
MDAWSDAIRCAPSTQHYFRGTIGATERFLLRVFLQRYITWCARRGRFKQMQGAARLHEQIA